MNGSYGGSGVHTVSVPQAKRLVEEVYNKVAGCKSKIDDNVNDFYNALATIWEDEFAVQFAKEVQHRVTDIVNDLNNKANDIMNEIANLANDYAIAGGKSERVSATRCSFSPSVNIGSVKNAFPDGASGFLGDNSGAREKVMSSLDGLYKRLIESGDNLINEMQKTNAFGNTDVKARLVVFAKNFKDGMTGEMFELTKIATNKISETEKKYQRVSSRHGGSNTYYGGSNTYGGRFVGGSNSSYNPSIGGKEKNVLHKTPDMGSSDDVFVTEGLSAGNGGSQSAGANIVSDAVSLAGDTIELGKTAIEDPMLVADAAMHTVAHTILGVPETTYKAVSRNQPMSDVFDLIKK